jgi:LacI family transcriptional regulator
MRRITLKDVASAANLSISCTARALKGFGDIPPSTCQRVHAIADNLGYRPDPMLTALAAYRRTTKTPSFQGTLAFLTTRLDEKACLAEPECGELLRGARRRAESLGYRMDYFNLGESKKSQHRVGEILRSRGIRGAVIRSFPIESGKVHLPFEKLICIDLFGEPHVQKLPTVSSYHAQSMELVLEKILQRGYQHPALILGNDLSNRLHHGWWMAFAVYSSRFAQASTYLHDGASTNFFTLAHWAKKRKVDVLIYCSNTYMQTERGHFLERLGAICMDLYELRGDMAGIYQNRARGGELAVEWLQSLLITAQLGIILQPNSLLIPGVWHEGKSLPFRTSRPSS